MAFLSKKFRKAQLWWYYSKKAMKGLKILWLLIAGSFLFLAGMLISPNYEAVKYTLLISGTVVVTVFYLVTLLRVINTNTLSQSRRIFWLIAVVCVPIMGNLAYVIIHDTLMRRQVPHGTW